MSLTASSYRFVVNQILGNPSATAATLIFGLGFTLVAGNAMYSQASVHPDPIWATKDGITTRSVVETVAVTPVNLKTEPVSITRSVLTQRISLKNIPIPTSRPTQVSTYVEKKPTVSNAELLRETQALLAKLGFYGGKIDGIYGSASKKAIMDYQSSANILPDGEATYELLTHLKSYVEINRRITQAAPEPARKNITQLIMPKSSEFDRQTIQRIQIALRDKFGVTDIDIDGIFGNQTREALKEFQKLFKIEETGEIDQTTLEKLQSTGIITAI